MLHACGKHLHCTASRASPNGPHDVQPHRPPITSPPLYRVLYRRVEVLLTYPAAAAAGARAPVSPGQLLPGEAGFPLVLMFNGFQCRAPWYRATVEHVSSWGYVVLQYTHTGVLPIVPDRIEVRGRRLLLALRRGTVQYSAVHQLVTKAVHARHARARSACRVAWRARARALACVGLGRLRNARRGWACCNPSRPSANPAFATPPPRARLCACPAVLSPGAPPPCPVPPSPPPCRRPRRLACHSSPFSTRC